MTNVLFDLSPFGLARYSDSSRGGIYHYTKNLAQELARLDNISLKFTASRYTLESHAHLCENLLLKKAKFLRGDSPLWQLMVGLELVTNKYAKNYPLTRRLNRKFSSTILGGGFLSSEYTRQIDVFHSTFFPFPKSIIENKKVKKLITIYDLIPVKFPEFFTPNQRADHKSILTGLDKDTWVICISNSTRDDLLQTTDSIDPSKVFVTPLAPSNDARMCGEPEIVVVRKKYGIPNGRYILGVGTLEPRKNIGALLACFSRIVRDKKYTDLHLVLVGAKGWYYEDILRKIDSDRYLKDRVVLTGYVDDNELPPLFSGALFFVYPSIYEGFGIPPLEAMACGCPVITSNTSSLPEVVGDAGFMVNVNDEDELLGRMMDLLQSDDLLAAYKKKSLKQAAMFSWGGTARKTADIYLKIAQS